MIFTSFFRLLMSIVIGNFHVIIAQYPIYGTQVYVITNTEKGNTSNSSWRDTTELMDLSRSTTNAPRIPSIFVSSVPLINSNCLCAYDQRLNSYQCSPYLYNSATLPLSAVNLPLINVTLNDCIFSNNRFNLPLIQGKNIDHLQINDINHQNYLLFDSTSFASYSINAISINYTYIQPITMLLLSSETFNSSILQRSLKRIHIESSYLLTLNQPFNRLIALQSITLMNIPQFSWYDFYQQIVYLPNLRSIYLGETIVSNNYDIFNVLVCEELSSQWMLTYRLLQTCSCHLMTFLSTVERKGNVYQCRNTNKIVDFIDNICQVNNREYLVRNQTDSFCRQCLSNQCPMGTFCAESFDLNFTCLLRTRSDYTNIRTRLPLTPSTQPYLVQENYQHLIVRPINTGPPDTPIGPGLIILDPNRTQPVNPLIEVQLLHQTFVEILTRPTVAPTMGVQQTFVQVSSWNRLIRSLDESIKNITDTEDVFEFKSKPISTVSLVFPIEQPPPTTFGWKIDDENTITTNITNVKSKDVNATARVFLQFDQSQPYASYYCTGSNSSRNCQNRFTITSLKSPKLFSETNGIPEYDVISIIAPTSNQHVTFYFDQKISSNTSISPSTNLTNTTSTNITNSTSRNSFYDQLDLMIPQGICMYLNMTTMLWQSDGCTTDRQISNNISVTCTCEHLTMFTVFFSLACEKPSMGLYVISWIGCGLSLIGLSIALVMFIVISQCRRSKNSNARKSSSQSNSTQELKRKPMIKANRLSMVKSMLFVLCILLILMNIFIFILTFVKPGRNIACTILSIGLYYFTLAAFLWKLCFALQQSLFITNIFRPFWSNRTLFIIYFILTFSLPIIPLIILFIKYPDWTFISSTCHFCWLTREFLFYGLVIPILVILCLNFLFYMYTMIYLYRTNREHPGLRSTKSDQSRYVQNFKIAIFFAVIMGFSWILGFLILIPNSYVQFVGNILFCIVNSIQGFAFSIMVFWMLERKSFRKYCCFWKYRNRSKTTIHSQGNSPQQLESISNDDHVIKVKNSCTSSIYITSTSNGEGNNNNPEVINRFRNPKLAIREEEEDEDDDEHIYTRLPL